MRRPQTCAAERFAPGIRNHRSLRHTRSSPGLSRRLSITARRAQPGHCCRQRIPRGARTLARAISWHRLGISGGKSRFRGGRQRRRTTRVRRVSPVPQPRCASRFGRALPSERIHRHSRRRRRCLSATRLLNRNTAAHWGRIPDACFAPCPKTREDREAIWSGAPSRIGDCGLGLGQRNRNALSPRRIRRGEWDG